MELSIQSWKLLHIMAVSTQVEELQGRAYGGLDLPHVKREVLALVGPLPASIPARKLCSVVGHDDMETSALAMMELLRISCWYGTQGHLCGFPTAKWKWGDIVGTLFLQPFGLGRRPRRLSANTCEANPRTPVIHAGAHLVVKLSEESAEVADWAGVDDIVENTMVLQDILDMRRMLRRDVFGPVSSQLLGLLGDDIEVRMKPLKYTADEVRIEVGWRAITHDY